MPHDHRMRPLPDSYMNAIRDLTDQIANPKKKMGSGKNEVASSLEDYEHWNEEAPIVKAQEDRWTDYYNDPRDNDDWDD